MQGTLRGFVNGVYVVDGTDGNRYEYSPQELGLPAPSRDYGSVLENIPSQEEQPVNGEGGFWSEFGKQIPFTLADTAKGVNSIIEYAGENTGSNLLKDVGKTGREYWNKAEQPYKPLVSNITDVHDVSSGLQWAGGVLGQTGTQFAMTMPFMTGRVIAGAGGGALSVMKNLASRNPGSLKAAGEFMASWLKPGRMDIPIGIMEAGQVTGAQLESLEKGEIADLNPMKALAGAYVATQLEKLGAESVVNRMLAGVGQRSASRILGAVKNSLATGAGEGAEEFFQNYAEAFGADAKDLTSMDQFMQAVNGAAAGFLGGHVIGGVAGAIQTPEGATAGGNTAPPTNNTNPNQPVANQSTPAVNLGTVNNTTGAVQYNSIDDALQSTGDTDEIKDARIDAAVKVSQILRSAGFGGSQELADAWDEYASDKINTGQEISLDSDIQQMLVPTSGPITLTGKEGIELQQKLNNKVTLKDVIGLGNQQVITPETPVAVGEQTPSSVELTGEVPPAPSVKTGKRLKKKSDQIQHGREVNPTFTAMPVVSDIAALTNRGNVEETAQPETVTNIPQVQAVDTQIGTSGTPIPSGTTNVSSEPINVPDAPIVNSESMAAAEEKKGAGNVKSWANVPSSVHEPDVRDQLESKRFLERIAARRVANEPAGVVVEGQAKVKRGKKLTKASGKNVTQAETQVHQGEVAQPVTVPDVSTMSTAELASGIIGIVAKHAAAKMNSQRGSISLEKSTEIDSLYQELKPYLQALRAKAIKLGADVKGYILGAVDAMPGEHLDLFSPAVDKFMSERTFEEKSSDIVNEAVKEGKNKLRKRSESLTTEVPLEDKSERERNISDEVIEDWVKRGQVEIEKRRKNKLVSKTEKETAAPEIHTEIEAPVSVETKAKPTLKKHRVRRFNSTAEESTVENVAPVVKEKVVEVPPKKMEKAEPPKMATKVENKPAPEKKVVTFENFVKHYSLDRYMKEFHGIDEPRWNRLSDDEQLTFFAAYNEWAKNLYEERHPSPENMTAEQVEKEAKRAERNANYRELKQYNEEIDALQAKADDIKTKRPVGITEREIKKLKSIVDSLSKLYSVRPVTIDGINGFAVFYKDIQTSAFNKVEASAQFSMRNIINERAINQLRVDTDTNWDRYGIRFSLSKTKGKMDPAEVLKVVNSFVQKMAIPPRVFIHNSVHDLKGTWLYDKLLFSGNGLEDLDAINGFVDTSTGNVYMFANKFDNREEVGRTLIHEVVGHYGMNVLLGEKYANFLDEVWSLYADHKLMRDIIKSYKIDTNTKRGQKFAANEFVAYAAETNAKDMSFLDYLVNMIKDWWHEVTGKPITMNGDEIVRLISMSHANLRYGLGNKTFDAKFAKDGVIAVDLEHNRLDNDIDPAMFNSKDGIIHASLGDMAESVGKFGSAFKESFLKSPSKPLGPIRSAFVSPEWWQHPILKQLYKYAEERSDLFHRNLHQFITIDPTKYTGDFTNAISMIKKRFGLDIEDQVGAKINNKMKANMVKYKRWNEEVNELIEHMDTQQIKWDKYRPQCVSKFDKEVIEMVDAQREVYDRILRLLVDQLKKYKERIEAEAKKAGKQPSYPSFVKYNDKGEAEVITIKQAMSEMGTMEGYYAPRVRLGNFFFTGEMKEGDDVKIGRWHGDYKIGLNMMREDMIKAGWTVSKVEHVDKLPETVFSDLKVGSLQQVVNQAMEKVANNANADDMDVINAQYSELNNTLRDILLSRGYRSHMIGRRKDIVVEGYEKDALKRLVVYTTNVASGLAKAETAQKMMLEINGRFRDKSVIEGGQRKIVREKVGGVNAAKEQYLYKTCVNYIGEQLKNSDEVDKWIMKIKQIASIKYLGLSLRAPLVNTTALVITAPPSIDEAIREAGGRGIPFVKILNELRKGCADYTRYLTITRNKGGITPASEAELAKVFTTDEMDFIRTETENGYDNPQYTAEAMGGILTNSIGTGMDRATKFSMSLFGLSEQLIRGATLIAGYRAAKSAGLNNDQALGVSKTATNYAHGSYGRASNPTWAMGDHVAAKVGQMFYMYMKFPHNMLQLLYHTGVRNRNLKSAAWLMCAPCAMSGVIVFPGYEMLSSFTAMMVKAFLGEDRDPEKYFWDNVRTNFGEDVEMAIKYGALGSIGIDISGSLSIGLHPPTDMYGLFGVAGSMVKDTLDAKELVAAGNYNRAMEKLLPLYFANTFKSRREYHEGLTSKTQQPIFDENGKRIYPSAVTTVARAVLGTNVPSIAEVQRRTYMGKRQLLSFSDRRKKIEERYRDYLSLSPKEQDPQDFRRIMQLVQKYNDSAMKLGGPSRGYSLITGETLRRQASKFHRPSRQAANLMATDWDVENEAE